MNTKNRTSENFSIIPTKHTVQPNYGKQNINTTFRETMVCNPSMLTKNYKHVIKYHQEILSVRSANATRNFCILLLNQDIDLVYQPLS